MLHGNLSIRLKSSSVRSLNRCRVGKLVSTIRARASPPKGGTEPGVRRGKRSLLASHTRCKCSMETTHNSVKVKLGIKVMKLVESLIGREVTVGQGSECHLTFVRELLHIAQQDPRIDHKTSWMTISSVPQGIPVWVAYWKVTEMRKKYRGMFETQMSGNKTSSGEIGLNIRTLASPKVGQVQVSGGVSVLCWHAAPVANVLWKPLAIR